MSLYITVAESPGEQVEDDVARAVLAALSREDLVEAPAAQDFDALLRVIAQTTQIVRHLTMFRDMAIVQADASAPSADRRQIGIAAAMPPSRLYRLLDQHGRPRKRGSYAHYDEQTQRMLASLVKGHVVEGTYKGRPFTGAYMSQSTDESGDAWLVLTDHTTQKPILVPAEAVSSYH